MDWETILNSRSIEDTWCTFKKEYERLCEKHIPAKRVHEGETRKPPWLNYNVVKKARKHKNQMWRTFKRSKLTSDRLLFDRANKEYRPNRAMIDAQIKHETTLYDTDSVKENPKRFYNHVRNFVKTDASVDHLITSAENQISDHFEIAEEFNRFFFSSVMTKCSPLQSDLPVQCPKPESSIHEVKITEVKIAEKLRSLKGHKSSGPDNIHVNVLKNCAAFSVPLAILFKRSFIQGYLPQDWRDANVCPIHKKGDRSQAKNYRPVSLTSQVAKLMEKLVLEDVTTHLTENNTISSEQHGFQVGSSCTTQLLECFDDWLTNLDMNLGTDIVYLDFTKALDCISHTHLLHKLGHYGIKGKHMRWLTAFLRDRRQRVVCQHTFSNWEPIVSGVPQGVLLSPILVLLYINMRIFASLCQILYCNTCFVMFYRRRVP